MIKRTYVFKIFEIIVGEMQYFEFGVESDAGMDLLYLVIGCLNFFQLGEIFGSLENGDLIEFEVEDPQFGE